MEKVKINNKYYQILDALEHITIPDCFVVNSNKIGTGHGEAKLYVGQIGEKINNFFENFNIKCIIKKSDLINYLDDSLDEYMNPDQNYKDKDKMAEVFEKNYERIRDLRDEIIEFKIFRSDVKPPRVYINSKSEAYNLIRLISLPNISYISILKLKSENETILYFRPFVEYIAAEATEEQKMEEKVLGDATIKPKVKEAIVKARIGQGEYRRKLLEMCPYCPITLVSDERLLIASHIKPWRKSNDFEKTDPNNGFMLTPTYDKLFDAGFISFESDGTMLVSPWISPMNQKRLNIYNGKKINLLTNKKEEYLFYHREFIFKQ